MAEYFYYGLIITICLGFSAFLSGAETAITSLGILRTKHLLDQEHPASESLKIWLNHPHKILTTILIWNTVCNIFIAGLVTELTLKEFGQVALGVATGLTTLLVLVVGEIIPKSFGKAYASSLSVPFLQIVVMIFRLSYPVVLFFAKFADWIVKRFGSQVAPSKPITEEELEYLMSVGKSEGVITGVKTDMISGVFEFDETKAREVMTPRTDIVALEKSSTLTDAVKVILESGHSRLPVYERRIDHVIGMLLGKDLMNALCQASLDRSATIESFVREAIFVPESKPLIDVFKDLKKTKNHLAVVIDEYGGTAGIITLEDIIEEIFGEIQDEYDVEEAKIKDNKDGSFDVVGSIHIAEFCEYFSIQNIAEDDLSKEVDTIAGWMTQQLGAMPKVGQSLYIADQLKLEVIEVGRHRIQRLKVRKLLNQDEEGAKIMNMEIQDNQNSKI